MPPLADSLFALPFAAGLLMAVVLPLIGVLLRLRDEWLAALGLAHLAGAGALLGQALHLPALGGALIGALSGGLVKSLASSAGNSAYALMILAGWSITLLLAANTALGSSLGHAIVEGQLYFAGWPLLLVSALLAVTVALAWPRLMPGIVRARLFPASASDGPSNGLHVGFDLLVAAAMAIATATLGLMGAFALVFVPAWLAFRIAGHWRHALAVAALFGTAAYVGAFFVALVFDQPFGPVLVGVLLAGGAAGWLPGGRRRRTVRV
jgi:zinc/manganese transport system permease protein